MTITSTAYKTIFAAGLLACVAGTARAQAAHEQVALSARLVNGGTPYDGSVTIQATLFASATGGLGVWTETEQGTASDGLVALRLGATSPIEPAITGGDLYLELSVNGTTLSPRLALGSAPYSMYADHAATADNVGGVTASELQRTITPLKCASGSSLQSVTAAGTFSCGPTPTYAAACTPGQVVTGLQANGTITCAAPAALGDHLVANPNGSATSTVPRTLCALSSVKGGGDCHLVPNGTGTWTLYADSSDACEAYCF